MEGQETLTDHGAKYRHQLIAGVAMVAVLVMLLVVSTVAFCRRIRSPSNSRSYDTESNRATLNSSIITRIIDKFPSRGQRLQRRQRKCPTRAELILINKTWFAMYSENVRLEAARPRRPWELVSIKHTEGRQVRFCKTKQVFFIETRKEMQRLIQLGERTDFRNVLIHLANDANPYKAVSAGRRARLPARHDGISYDLPYTTNVLTPLQKRQKNGVSLKRLLESKNTQDWKRKSVPRVNDIVEAEQIAAQTSHGDLNGVLRAAKSAANPRHKFITKTQPDFMDANTDEQTSNDACAPAILEDKWRQYKYISSRLLELLDPWEGKEPAGNPESLTGERESRL